MGGGGGKGNDDLAVGGGGGRCSFLTSLFDMHVLNSLYLLMGWE